MPSYNIPLDIRSRMLTRARELALRYATAGAGGFPLPPDAIQRMLLRSDIVAGMQALTDEGIEQCATHCTQLYFVPEHWPVLDRRVTVQVASATKVFVTNKAKCRPQLYDGLQRNEKRRSSPFEGAPSDINITRASPNELAPSEVEALGEWLAQALRAKRLAMMTMCVADSLFCGEAADTRMAPMNTTGVMAAWWPGATMLLDTDTRDLNDRDRNYWLDRMRNPPRSLARYKAITMPVAPAHIKAAETVLVGASMLKPQVPFAMNAATPASVTAGRIGAYSYAVADNGLCW